ncbi:MAG TPA: hypothetical protein VGN20_00755 [Mucilaginibacter sp.]|jgi:hypothetical protein
MRKLLFICIFLFSCKQQKNHSTYIIILNYDEYSRGGYSPAEKKDTISANNDTVAFKKGFSLFSNEIFMSKDVGSGRSNPMRKNISFKVVDKNGKNIQEKLSKRVIDSIENKINKETEQIFNDLKKIRKSN